MDKMVFALYFANRGFFPETLIAGAREELTRAVEQAGHGWIAMDPSATRNGAIETAEEGRRYAKFLKEHEGQFDGVILCLPNFGDENGAVPALRDANVPIFIQAYPDEIGKMDFESRRDSFCGKFSIEDMFNQYGIRYTVFAPHVVHPLSEAFQQNLRDFAAVCNVVKRCRRYVIGGIGARTTAFKTVRYDELALEKYGITVESHDLSELFARIKNMKEGRSELADKKNELRGYADFSKAPDERFDTIARMAVAIEDMIAEYHFDTVSIRCWNEMHQQLGVAPCVLLGALNDRGIAASCEMDVANVITMRALESASGAPAACLDWNNNYGDDPDKCILFHCGPVARALMAAPGTVAVHKMFAKGTHPDQGWGVNEGRIKPMPMTYASAATMDGKIFTYAGAGEITADPIEKEFFGCAGVAKIDGLQKKLIYMGRSGFRHHTTLTEGNVLLAVEEAFKTYLKYETVIL